MKLTIEINPRDRKRIEAMATKSGVSLEHWIHSALMSAASVDEAHWLETAERERVRAELARDRHQFVRLSRFFQSMPDRTFETLVDHMVMQREKGRAEGSESATRRLAALKAKRPSTRSKNR